LFFFLFLSFFFFVFFIVLYSHVYPPSIPSQNKLFTKQNRRAEPKKQSPPNCIALEGGPGHRAFTIRMWTGICTRQKVDRSKPASQGPRTKDQVYSQPLPLKYPRFPLKTLSLYVRGGGLDQGAGGVWGDYHFVLFHISLVNNFSVLCTPYTSYFVHSSALPRVPEILINSRKQQCQTLVPSAHLLHHPDQARSMGGWTSGGK
jgi:hypothetical protein